MTDTLKLLASIQSPADLKKLPVSALPGLSAEIRAFLVDVVSRQGGHLASSLGVVELTVALHYCFDSPRDKIIWDVGHQAYVHKMLTGRRDRFHTLRQYGGISGFPRVSENPCDALSSGHASTSISAGLGMAIARDRRGENHHVVSVIGDGSLSGGLAFEGLNNLGAQSTRMIVVLNDNEMSIAKNVGALSRYLTRIITDRRFNKIKTEVWELLGRLSNVGKGIRDLVHGVDDALKHFVIPGKLFEDFGLRYFGPVDGHNCAEMIELFRFVKDQAPGPVLVHVLTKKGKGYSFAEDDSTKFHGVGSFSKQTGDLLKTRTIPTYSEVFGRTLEELARTDRDIVAITAAMPDGTGLSGFRDRFPDRFFDVGIAEEHAVTFAAGLALAGQKPVVALYSTFLQRAFDQTVHDIALDGLHVVFCVDRAGLVGDDGPTHHGMFDLSYLRAVPGVTIMAPSNENELRAMLHTALYRCAGPVFIRYPRGSGTGEPVDGPCTSLENGKPRVVREGADVAVIAAGAFLSDGAKACDILAKEGISAALIDARFVKPLDTAFYAELFSAFGRIVTLESNSIAGGFGGAVLEEIARSGAQPPPRVLCLGYPDSFITHGTVDQLHRELGLDPAAIASRIQAFIGRR